ncbi:MAG: cation:proton antiporter [Actinobacteria bacterium]|nr:MAG: cation:proton antiporter [Actinomycetota bacterium]
MVHLSFTSLAIVAAVAFAAPLALGLAPALRLPSVVLEIVLGIVVGPSVLGWVHVDPPVEVLSLLGLAFLLLLAGLEVEFDMLRGQLLRLTAAGFALSFGIALAVGLILDAAGLTGAPLLLAIMLSATSLGVVIPVLKDSGEASTQFGQLVIAAASIADVATIVLLSLFFSQESSGVGAKLVLLGGFAALVGAIGIAVLQAQRSMRISKALVRLQDTTAQIRVRGAFVLLTAFVVLAEKLGLEAILGAFVAGAVLKLVDTDRAMTHPQFRRKLEAAGFGVFVPFFFVTSGVRFNLDALFASGSTIARVPIFVVALLAARGVPALLYRRTLGERRTAAAALLQATSLSFLVVAGQIGMELGLISQATGAALVAAGLLSVLLFPLAALTLLHEGSAGVAGLEPEPLG